MKIKKNGITYDDLIFSKFDKFIARQNLADRLKVSMEPLLNVEKNLAVNSSLQTVSAIQKEFINGTPSILELYLGKSRIQMEEFTSIIKPIQQRLMQNPMLSSYQISDDFMTITEQSRKKLSETINIEWADSLKKFVPSFSSMLLDGQTEQLEQLTKIDYSSLISNVAERTNSIEDILNTVYETIQEEEWEEEDTELETDFSSVEEMQESIQEQITNPEGFQERVANWAEIKRKKFVTVQNHL